MRQDAYFPHLMGKEIEVQGSSVIAQGHTGKASFQTQIT